METIVKRIDHLMQFMMHVKKVKKSRAKYCTSKSLLKKCPLAYEARLFYTKNDPLFLVRSETFGVEISFAGPEK